MVDSRVWVEDGRCPNTPESKRVLYHSDRVISRVHASASE